MNFIENIFSFFKKIFCKNEEIKLIEASVKEGINQEKENFINSLKVDIAKKKKKEVETQICVGDGLGIQTKFSF